MNKYKTYSLLILIPIIFFFIANFLRETEGPFYFNTGYDPNYVYAVSSLNLINSEYAIHTDHPGSTVQLISACTLLASGNSVQEITESVLSDPESHLSYFSNVLILINSTCLFVLGVIIFCFTGNLALSLLMQISPFISSTLIFEFTQTTAEIFLIPMMMIFISLLFAYRKRLMFNDTSILKFDILFGLISGICLATKITFIPVLIIPIIILIKFSNKLIFAFVTLIIFVSITFPVMGSYEYFLDWIGKIFVHDGLYGTGNRSVLNPGIFWENIISIVTKDPFFILIFASGFFSYFISKASSKFLTINKVVDRKILFSILTAVSFQILIVSKHYSQHYLVPSLMLSLFIMFLIHNISSDFYKQFINRNSKYFKFIVVVSFSVISIFFLSRVYLTVSETFEETKEIIDVSNDMRGNKSIGIYSYGSSDKDYGLMFSMNWAGKNKDYYKSIIMKHVKKNIYMDFWDNEVIYYDEFFDPFQIPPNLFLRLKFYDFNENAVEKFEESLYQKTGIFGYNSEEIIRISTGETIIKLNKK